MCSNYDYNDQDNLGNETKQDETKDVNFTTPLNDDLFGSSENTEKFEKAEKADKTDITEDVIGDDLFLDGNDLKTDNKSSAKDEPLLKEEPLNEKVDFYEKPKDKSTPLPLYETAKLFGVSEEKLTAEFNAYKASKLFRRVNLFAVDCKIGEAELKSLIKSSVELGLESVTVLPYNVNSALKIADGRIRIRTTVSYPYGSDIVKHKNRQISAFSRLGLGGIELPLRIKDLSEKKPRVIVKEWKKYRRKAGKTPLIMVVDFDLLTMHEVKIVCDIVKEVGIKIKTSTCLLSNGSCDFQKGGSLNCLENLQYELATKAPSAKDILSMFMWGTDTVSSPNAIEALKEIKKLLGCE